MKRAIQTVTTLACVSVSFIGITHADPWTPAETTTALWLDAADATKITADGSNDVSQWDDKSGNDRHATQTGSAGDQPNTGGAHNSLNVITLDGTGFFNLGTGLDWMAPGTAHTTFVMLKVNSGNNIYGAANGSSGANSLHVGFNGSNYRMNYWGNDYGVGTTNLVGGEFNFLRFNWVEGGAKSIYANSSLEGMNGGGAGNIQAMAGGGRIGNITGQGRIGADIAEIIFIDGTPDPATTERIEGYLAWKWGEEDKLPIAHPYKTAAPLSLVNDTTPPSLASTFPVDDASGIYPAADLVATFSEDIALITGGTITLVEDPNGTPSSTIITLPDAQVSVSGADLIISPTANLAFGTEYEVIIGGADNAGTDAIEDTFSPANAFVGTSSGDWSFTTVAQDLTAPVITPPTSPADDATGVLPNAPLVATFDENIVVGSGDIELIDLDDATGDQTIAVTDASQVSVAGNVLTINLATPMEANTNFAIQIDAGSVKNFSDVDFGGILAGDTTTWNFGTAGALLLTWDPSGGGSSDGNGTWLDAGKWWDGSSNVDWGNATPDSAIFGNGGNGGSITMGAVNATSVLFDNFSGQYQLSGGSLDQSGGITVGPNAGNVKFTGTLSGDGGITHNGNGIVDIYQSTNNFTGDMVFNGGILFNQSNLPASPGNMLLNGAILENRWNGAFNWALGTGANEIQVTGGAAGFSGQGASAWTVDIPGTLQWGDPLFNPSVLVLQSTNANTNGKLSFNSPLDLNGADRTIEVAKNEGNLNGGNFLVDGYAQINDPISNSDGGNAAGLAKQGPGRLILNAANTYDGGTTVNAGAVQYDRADAMPGTGTHTFNDGTELWVRVGGGGQFTAGASGAGTLGGLLSGTGSGASTTAFSGTVDLVLRPSGSQSYAGPLSMTGGTMGGLWIFDGNMTLSGTGSYTGATNIGRRGGSPITVTLGSSTALPSGTPVTVDTTASSKLDLAGFDATIGELKVGSNNGGSRGQVLDTVGGGTLTMTDGLTHDSHNGGNGAIYVDTLDLNGATQTFSIQNGSADVDIEVSSSLQNGGLSLVANNSNAVLGLTGASTYAGGTQVASGKLRVNGSLGDSSMSISGGRVEGSGTLTFNVSGASIDQIVMTGGTLDASALTVNISGTLTEPEYVLVDATGGGSISGAFAGITGDQGYSLDYGTANQVKLVGSPDGDPPSLDSIVDDKSGGPIFDNQTVIYTVTFDEAMDAGTIGTDDFENGGSPAASIDSVTGSGAIYTVTVTPGGVGNLILQIKQDAVITDAAGNALDTTAGPLPDDTDITVTAAPPTALTILSDQATEPTPDLTGTILYAYNLGIGTNVNGAGPSDTSSPFGITFENINITGNHTSSSPPPIVDLTAYAGDGGDAIDIVTTTNGSNFGAFASNSTASGSFIFHNGGDNQGIEITGLDNAKTYRIQIGSGDARNINFDFNVLIDGADSGQNMNWGPTGADYALLEVETSGRTSIDIELEQDGGGGAGIGYVMLSEVVATNPFNSWATTGSMGAVTFEGDTNGDGVQDGLAFLLGAVDPDVDANAAGLLPTVSEDGSGGLVLNFNCLPIADRGTAVLNVEHSTDLATWTATVSQVPDADELTPDNDVTFGVVAGPAGPPTVNTVTATIDSAAAGGGDKLFGRLSATE